MVALLYQSLLLAQDAQPAGETDAFFRMIFPLVIIMFLFYFLMIRPQKRKDQEFRQMVAGLKENDHVVTVGGIHGVVTNVQRDAERVTIRVDDATGTKLRVTASSIARVITENGSGADAATSGKTK